MERKTVLSLFFMLGFIGCCIWGCERAASYSDIPEIGFKSLVFEYVNTPMGNKLMAVLICSFVDGDGDIGVRTRNDSISKIHYIWYKKLPDMTYVPHQFPSGSIADSTVIPWGSVMNKEEAHNKSLKGTIRIALDKPANIQGIDTMRIEFYIVDRARNPSNIEYTPDFSIQNLPTEPITK